MSKDKKKFKVKLGDKKPKVSTESKAERPEGKDRRVLARPRRRTDAGDYDFKSDSDTRGGLPPGNLYFDKANLPPVTVMGPAWKGEVPTIWRPFPALNPEDLYTFLHGRKSSKENHYTDWMRGLPGVKYVGVDSKLSFLLYDPRQKKNGYEPRENPYNILFYNLKPVCGQKGTGEAILGRRNVATTKWPAIFSDFSTPNNKVYFSQGAVIQHNRNIYVAGGKPPLGLGPKDLPVIMQMQSAGGGYSLLEKLNAKKDDNADSDDFEAMFEHPDPTDLVNGRFLGYFNPKLQKAKVDFLMGLAAAQDDEEDEDVDYEDPSADSGDDRKGEKGGFIGWEGIVSPECVYINKAGKRKRAKLDISEYADRIREQYLWWDDILKFPTHEEICVWLAQAFKSVPNMLRFGWADNPEFFSEEVEAILSARAQGTVPGDDDDEENDDEDDAPPPKSKKDKKGKNKRSKLVIEDDEDDGFEDDEDELDDEEESDDDADSDDSDDADSNDEDDDTDSDDDDTDDDDDSDDDSDDEDSDDEDDDDDDAKAKAAAAAKKRASKRRAADDDDEDADKEENVAKKKAAAKKSTKSTTKAASKKSSKKK